MPRARHASSAVRESRCRSAEDRIAAAAGIAAGARTGARTSCDSFARHILSPRPGLRWVDVWATYDPAPAGPLPTRGGIAARDAGDDASPATPVVVATADPSSDGWLLQSDVGATDPDPTAPTITVESRPVTNQMNVLTDHGGYWANPEGFLVPLVRHLDAARGGASRR